MDQALHPSTPQGVQQPSRSSAAAAQPGGRSPDCCLLPPASFIPRQTSPRDNSPPAVTSTKPPAQANISVIKGLACASGTLPFPSTAAELMYYSHPPSCPDMALAGSFLYWAPLGEKVGLGCASVLINHKSSASFALQPGSWLPLAFSCILPRGRAGRSCRDAPGWGQSPPAMGTVAVPPPRTLQREQRHLPGAQELGGREGFPFKCTWLWGRFFPFLKGQTQANK